MDWDNAAASIKPLQDAIVATGLLPGDDWQTLEGQVHTFKVRKKTEERVEIQLLRLR